MKKQAFEVIWYHCPKCDAINDMDIDMESNIPPTGKCHNCNSTWNVMDLHKKYGVEGITSWFIPDKYTILASKYECDCGAINYVFNRCENKKRERVSEDMDMIVEGGRVPVFGLCEICGKEYDLFY